MGRTGKDADPGGEEEAGSCVGGVAQLPQHRPPQQHHKLRPPAAHTTQLHQPKNLQTMCVWQRGVCPAPGSSIPKSSMGGLLK